MTKKQEKMVEFLRKNILEWDSYGHPETREVKVFKVSEIEGTNLVAVYSVVGLKDDEGTVASILCRTYRHMFIGKNGGIFTRIYNSKTGKYRLYEGITQVRIHGYYH